jgi:hypothetical protein
MSLYKLQDWVDLDKLDWSGLSINSNAIHLLENNQYKIDWNALSTNPNAIHLLEKNMDKINWRRLSYNPNVIHLLEKNMDKINWEGLSRNSNAIHLLEKNLDKVDWYLLSYNLNIFELDLVFIKTRMDILREDLMKKLFHPTRVMRFWNNYGYDILEDKVVCTDEE